MSYRTRDSSRPEITFRFEKPDSGRGRGDCIYTSGKFKCDIYDLGDASTLDLRITLSER